ncbi:MAG: hypothetical protein B9S32_08970 [Verrucomicrobia bacterium Tous-C9LFEB]|nr:MAG: hypothetical protein B9S32_08970 [Verrucomicrobia bacterium Tous-C9LFEB]
MRKATITPLNEKDGFTLAEVILVVAIVCLTAALALPSFKRALATARDAKCVSNLRQIGAAMRVFAADNEGKLPAKSTAADRTSWQTRLQPYMGMNQNRQLRKSFNCPEAALKPDMNDGTDNRTTYGMTVYSTVFENYLSRVADSPILLVVDMPTANLDDRGPWNDGRTSYEDRKEMFRHNNRMSQNGVFSDGHVEAMRPSRAGMFLPEGSPNAWLPAGYSYRFSGYWITPSPGQPTDNIR